MTIFRMEYGKGVSRASTSLNASSTTARSARLIRAVAQDSKRGFWVLADQGVVSLGNFGLAVVLARHFEAVHALKAYGAFGLLMELMLFINGIQAALLIYPLTLRGATSNRRTLGKMTAQALLATTAAAPLLIGAMLITAAIAGISLWVGAWAGIALISWQLQETTRRALISHLRFRAACLGDSISYVGQVLLVLLLSHLGQLDLLRTFQAIAITSAATAVMQSMQLGLRRTGRREVIAFTRECWTSGRWILFGNLTNLCSGPLFNWNFAYWAGLETLGTYYALINLTRLLHPLAFAVGTIVTPMAAKTLAAQDFVRARRSSTRLALLGGVLLLPYISLLLVAPNLVLRIFYGANSPHVEYLGLIRVSALAVTMVYIATAAGAFLNGVDRARESFYGQLLYATLYLLAVMPLTATFGLAGAVWGWLLAAALRAALSIYFSRQSRPETVPTKASQMIDIPIVATNVTTNDVEQCLPADTIADSTLRLQR